MYFIKNDFYANALLKKFKLTYFSKYKSKPVKKMFLYSTVYKA